MLDFLGGVMLGSAIWVALGSFLGAAFPDGSKARETFHGLAAFAAFCCLAAFAGSLAALAFTILQGL